MLITLVVIFVASIILGVAAQFWHRDSSLSDILRRGSIRVGYAIEAPYAFLEADGTTTGLDPELARLIARQLGIQRIEFRLVDFGSLIAGLNSGQFDVVAAGMFITPERDRLVAFSEPTFQVRPGLLVRLGNPRNLHSYQDIVRDPEARVAALSGSVEQAALIQAGVPPERIKNVPDARSGRLLVDTAQVDAFALSAPAVQWMTMRDRMLNAEPARPFQTTPYEGSPRAAAGAMAFRKADVSLRSAWDRELKRFVGSPEHLRLAASFGFSTSDLPPGVNHPQPAPTP